jgi:AraC-like DNA-binding protein
LSACLYRFGITENKRDSNELKAVERVLPALRYISENYSKQITLEEVSCILSVDKAHFCRLFKKAMNVSFTDYLNFVRLNHAEELLRKTDMSVSEIAYEVGILSSSYFAEIFKKFNSITPTQYRKMSVDM